LASMGHLKLMLRQMLTSEQIPNIKQWEETLLNLALRIARELTFTTLPHRQGEDMDVRRYVKIKKIPGGIPSNSEYVHGAVITKNVAHKQMSRAQRNPRVMLVTFTCTLVRSSGKRRSIWAIWQVELQLSDRTLCLLRRVSVGWHWTLSPSIILLLRDPSSQVQYNALRG
jgi:hypothetical protein